MSYEENDQGKQWPPFDPRYRRYINTREREKKKKCIPEARMKCSVCTFVNASWHGCAPTIMYCLASGSGYREPVSAQVFGVLQCYSAPLLFSINFFLFRSHLCVRIYIRTYFTFPFSFSSTFLFCYEIFTFGRFLKPEHLRLKEGNEYDSV